MSTFYNVWYMRPEHFRAGICGALPAYDLSTHVKVEEIKIDYAHSLKGMLDFIYMQQQAENWSPNGEARALIESLGLEHTSMSIGDVVEHDGKFWVVTPVGFKALP